MRIFILIKWERFKDWFALKFCNPYKVQPYGCAPVQAEGTTPCGHYYYFRARGNRWRLDVAYSEREWWNSPKQCWTTGGEYGKEFDASYMPTYDVVKFATQAIKNYETEQASSWE